MKNFCFLLLPVLFLFNSCFEPSLCEKVDCGSHGQCDEADGKCLCTTGYEIGTDRKCNTETRTKFLGTWNATETCIPQTTNPLFTVGISPIAADMNKVRIAGFANFPCGTDSLILIADVKDSTLVKFTESCTTINLIASSGKISSDKKTLRITYEIEDDSSNIYSCNAVFVR